MKSELPHFGAQSFAIRETRGELGFRSSALKVSEAMNPRYPPDWELPPYPGGSACLG